MKRGVLLTWQLREVFDAIDHARDNTLNLEELKASFVRLGFKVCVCVCLCVFVCV